MVVGAHTSFALHFIMDNELCVPYLLFYFICWFFVNRFIRLYTLLMALLYQVTLVVQ